VRKLSDVGGDEFDVGHGADAMEMVDHPDLVYGKIRELEGGKGMVLMSY